MPRHVWLSDAAVEDLERIREWLTQPGAGAVGAIKLADLLDSLAELDSSRNSPRPRRDTRSILTGPRIDILPNTAIGFASGSAAT